MGLWYWIITLTCSIIIFVCLLFSPKMGLLVKQPQLSKGFLKKNQQKICLLQNANNCHSYKTALLTFEWWPLYTSCTNINTTVIMSNLLYVPLTMAILSCTGLKKKMFKKTYKYISFSLYYCAAIFNFHYTTLMPLHGRCMNIDVAHICYRSKLNSG